MIEIRITPKNSKSFRASREKHLIFAEKFPPPCCAKHKYKIEYEISEFILDIIWLFGSKPQMLLKVYDGPEPPATRRGAGAKFCT